MRRFVLVLVIVAVLGLIVGGGWWYFHRNSGVRLLGRAELALRAQKYGRAIELAREYTAANPSNWRGYQVQAQAYTASGRYEEARRALDDAAEIAPDQTDIWVLRSNTYANPARATLRKMATEDPDLPLETVRAAVEQLKQAQQVLQSAFSSVKDRPLAVNEALGLLLNDLGSAYERIRHRLRTKAEIVEDAKQEEQARQLRAEAEQASADANRCFQEAADMLLQAVKEAARGSEEEPGALPRQATNALVDVCRRGENQPALEALSNVVFKNPSGTALSDLVLESENPPLMAVTTLIERRVQQGEAPRGSTAYTKRVRQACEQLDAVLDRFASHPGALQVRLVRAQMAMEVGDLDTAESLCSAILEDLPNQRNARLIQALIAMERGKMAEAEEKLLALKTDAPHWQAVKIYYAQAAMEIGNRERAREALRSVTEQSLAGDPQASWEKRLAAEVTRARLMLAASLLQDDLPDQALGEIQHVLDREGGTPSPQAYHLYFWGAVCAGQPGLAREPLAEALARYPDEPAFARLLLRYPDLLDSAGRAEDAETKRQERLQVANETLKSAAETVLAKTPGNPNALRLLVHATLTADGDRDPVLAALRRAAKAHRDDQAVQAAVADGYTALGKEDEARQATERIAAGTPKELRDQLLAAQSNLRLGKPAEAERVLRDAVDANPRSHQARAMLAEVYLKTRREMQAIDQLREAVSLAPSRVPYRLALARTLLRAGLMEEANGQVQAVLARNPENADAAFLADQIRVLQGKAPETEDALEARVAGRTGRPLAQAYLARGEPEACIEICRKVLEKDPADVATRWLLGRALLTVGDRAGAIEALTAALKAAPDHLPLYQFLAIVLAADRDGAKVEAHLASIPGARRDLINLASATVLERQGKYEAAAEAYTRVIDGTDTDENYRTIARIHKGRCLATAGHTDLALLELDRVPDDTPLHTRVMLIKAALLADTDRQAKADATLKAVRDTAVAADDLTTLAQVGEMYLRTGRYETALDVADEAAEVAPKNPHPLLLRAAALSGLDRLDEAIPHLRQAVALQPDSLGLHPRLARALDKVHRRREALQALDALKKHGRTGQTLALFEKGRMLRRWGLQKQAVRTLSELADRELAETPRVRILLGQALAVLGRKEKAREQLAAIPRYSRVYLPARQLLAQLADSDEEKLAILQAAEKENAQPALAAQRIALLLDAGRPADAVQALQATMAGRDGEDAVPPLRVAMVGIRALLQNDQQAEAADLAARAARRSGRMELRHVALLLALEADPSDVPDLLPPPERAGLADTLLGICRVVLSGGDVAPWAKRLSSLRDQAAQADSSRRIPAARDILASIAAGNLAQADTLLTDAGAVGSGGVAMVRELLQAAGNDPAVRKEAAAILATVAAMELGLTDFAHRWALETLRNRPESQWAASAAALGVTDSAGLRNILDILKPDDCVTARLLRLNLLRREGKWDDAVALARDLAETHKDRPDLLMDYASTLEQAGHLEKALAQYEKVWEASKNPAAANNAAYLTSVLYPDDKQRLRQAIRWSDAAVEAAPEVGAFRDTRGWIACLLGNYDEAHHHLCEAVKRLTTAAEVHYHLGMAESKLGHGTLARWHLETAVDLAEAAEANEGGPTEGQVEAGRLAQAALKKLEGTLKP